MTLGTLSPTARNASSAPSIGRIASRAITWTLAVLVAAALLTDGAMAIGRSMRVTWTSEPAAAAQGATWGD